MKVYLRQTNALMEECYIEMMKRCIVTGLVIWILIPTIAGAASIAPDHLDELRNFALSLINESRSAEYLPTLSYSEVIERVAQAHADDAAAHFDSATPETREQSYLAHTSSDGRSLGARYKDAGVDTGWGYAENVGYWTRTPYGESIDASRFGLKLMHDGMMAEVPPNDSHRINILGEYTHVGLGMSLLYEASSYENAIFFVSNFSRYSDEKSERDLRNKLLGAQATSPRSLLFPLTPTHGGPFQDVRPDDPYAVAISTMKALNIIKGYEDGTYLPGQTVSRAELLKMLLDAIHFSPIGREFSSCFSDVSNQWFAPYVCVSHRNGWVKGYDDGTFRPGQPVTRSEGVTLAARIIPMEESQEHVRSFRDIQVADWYADSVADLAANNILPYEGALFEPGKGMTRGEVAEMIYRSIRKNLE